MAAFPLILIAVILYNLVAFGGGAAGHGVQAILDQSFSVTMFSGDVWKITVSDVLILVTLGLLFMEIIRAARSSQREVLNHALSMIVFCIALVEFIVLKGFSTSAFFLITAMCLFDVVAGYTISIVAARRDLGVMPVERDR